MTLFITIQNTYTHVEIGLYNNDKKIANKQCTNKAASADIVPLIIELFDKAQIKLQECSFIAVNQGPGPFTTLRVVLATVNGISFASQIPLIGIDGLHTFLDEHASPEYPFTIALLNAFNQEVYYGIQNTHNSYETGYAPINKFIATITEKFAQRTIRFIGNGVHLYREKIEDELGPYALFANNMPETVSLDALAEQALNLWQNKTAQLTQQLLPLYLKKHAVER